MNIEYLKYFYLIARAGSISSVAQSEHISQSALSQQLQKLEYTLDKKLLDRSNKGVVLTPAGKIVYKYSENILRTYDEMMKEVNSESGDMAHIKIEASPAIADYALPCTLIEARKQYPYYSYEIKSCSTDEIITNISNNVCDMGYVYSTKAPKNYGSLKYITIGTTSIVLVAKYNEVIPETMKPNDLCGNCIVTFSGKNTINDLIDDNINRFFTKNNRLDCTLEVEGVEAAKRLVSRGYGMAFLPYISVREELYKKQFKAIEVSGFMLQLDIDLVYKQDSSRHTGQFIDWFTKNGTKNFC